MEIAIRQDPKHIQIEISGYMDEPGAQRFKQQAGDLDLSGGPDLTVDFSGLTRIGSAGIGQLLLLYKAVTSEGGTMHIQGVSPDVLRLFKSLKLDTLFPISG